MEFKKIVFKSNEGVAEIILNSSKNLNAIDEEMVDEIMVALKEVEEDSDIKCLVLSGEGKGFSAGGDIRMMVECVSSNKLDALDGGILKVGKLSLALKKSPKPVIASVHGAVAGAGFNVALACDFIIASEDSKFIQAFVNIGLVPDAGGVYLLTRAVGVNKATYMIMTGQPVNAEEGMNLGFVSMVVPFEELKDATRNFARRISMGPSLSYSKMKELIYESEFAGFEKFLELEEQSQKFCGRTEDFKEGIMSFVQKRKPEFTGK